MEFFTVMGKVWTEYSSLFLHGLWMTLYMGALTVLISTVSGSLMAMMHRSSWGIGRFKPLHAAAVVYVEVIRGTPILLQLYFFYFMLPQWFPALDLSEFTCVMIACCVNSTAYVCEIVRAGIQAVDAGQTEAARSLGLNSRQAMIHIVLPQAVKNILPALCNEGIAVLKETSIVGLIAVVDLTRASDLVRSRTLLAFFPLVSVALIYFLLVFGLSTAVGHLERRLAKSDRG